MSKRMDEITEEFIKEAEKIMKEREDTLDTNVNTLDKEMLDNLIKILEDSKPRLYVNKYIPKRMAITFDDINDNSSYGMNSNTFDEIVKTDENIMNGFKVIRI